MRRISLLLLALALVCVVSGCDVKWLKGDSPTAPEAIEVVAAFTHTQAFNSLRVQFTDQSENAVRREWSFGDTKDNSTEENPVHVYDEVGDYFETVFDPDLTR